MSWYRKKPVVIEAVQFTGEKMPLADVPQWLMDAMLDRIVQTPEGDRCLIIKTLEGDHRADLGDWIIQGIQGELYPCKPDIFAATYEAVE